MPPPCLFSSSSPSFSVLLFLFLLLLHLAACGQHSYYSDCCENAMYHCCYSEPPPPQLPGLPLCSEVFTDFSIQSCYPALTIGSPFSFIVVRKFSRKKWNHTLGDKSLYLGNNADNSLVQTKNRVTHT